MINTSLKFKLGVKKKSFPYRVIDCESEQKIKNA